MRVSIIASVLFSLSLLLTGCETNPAPVGSASALFTPTHTDKAVTPAKAGDQELDSGFRRNDDNRLI